MSIETELIAAKTYLDNCYDAVGAAGGTVPQNKCLANLPDAIDTIGSGVSPSFCIPRYRITANGSVAVPNAQLYPSTMFSNIVEIKDHGLYKAFDGLDCFVSLDFTNLATLGEGAFEQAFSRCASNLVSVSFPSLITSNKNHVLYYAFDRCYALSSVSFPVLQTLTGDYSLNMAFYSCTSLASVSFPSLTTVSYYAFGPLTFSGCTNLTEIHFKASAQSAIESMGYYSSRFGAPSTATIYFDL